MAIPAERGTPDSWLSLGGGWYRYGPDGKLAPKGWLVTGSAPSGASGALGRYWIGEGGALLRSGLVDDPSAGWLAYATPAGEVVRGRWEDPSTGWVYLADNDGRLAGGQSGGWVVTGEYSNGALERYWVDPESHACEPGFSTEGWAHETRPHTGEVVRGRWEDPSTGYIYLADNDGCLLGGETGGWVVTGEFSDGSLERYWVDPKSHACQPGFSNAGWAHYTTASGAVLRGALQQGGSKLMADNDGRLAEGWVVTGAFTGSSLERYWFDEGRAVAGRLVGPSEGDASGYYAYALADGRILRGSLTREGVGVYLADNDGRLLGGLSGGWAVTGVFSGGQLQRYFVDPSSHAVRTGVFEVSAKEAPSLHGEFMGVNGKGYVVRNQCVKVNAQWYSTNNEGLLSIITSGKIGYQNPFGYYQLSANNVLTSHPGQGIFSYVSPSVIAPDASRSDCVEAFINRAYDYMGTSYIWDYACAPGVGVDCAGLVLQCMYAVGVDPVRYTPYDHYHTPGHDHYANDMRGDGKLQTVNLADRRRGDLICYAGHIGIYLGNDKIINAYPPQVQVQSIWDYGSVLGVKRLFV